MYSEGFVSYAPQKIVEREPGVQFSPLIIQSVNYAGKTFLQDLF